MASCAVVLRSRALTLRLPAGLLTGSLYCRFVGRTMDSMAKVTARKRRPDLVVPAISVDFEEAVSRLLRVKPPKPKSKQATKKR